MKITKKMMAMLLAVLFVCTMLPLSSLARTAGSFDAGLLKEGSAEDVSLEESDEEEGLVFGKTYTVLKGEKLSLEFVLDEGGPIVVRSARLSDSGDGFGHAYLYDGDDCIVSFYNDKTGGTERTAFLAANTKYRVELDAYSADSTLCVERLPVTRITAGYEEDIKFTEANQGLYYVFTAEKAGTFILTSSSAVGDPYLEVYNEDWEYVDSFDDAQNSRNFRFEEEFEVGETVGFYVHFYNDRPGRCHLSLFEAAEPTGIKIVKSPYDRGGFVGEWDSYTAYVMPENAPQQITWSVSDEEIAQMYEVGDDYICLFYKNSGTFTLTAETPSGVKEQVEITVGERRMMELDKEYTFEMNKTLREDCRYFIPEETGDYCVLMNASSPSEISAYAYEWSPSDSGDNTYGCNCVIKVHMTAGKLWMVSAECEYEFLEEYGEEEVTATVKICKATEPDGFVVFDDGERTMDKVYLYPYTSWYPYVGYAPYGGSVSEGLLFGSDDEDVLTPVDNECFEAKELGTAGATITGVDSGLSTSIPVEVIEPAKLKLGETVDTYMTPDGLSVSAFTPEEDGTYRITSNTIGRCPMYGQLFYSSDGDSYETIAQCYDAEIDGKQQVLLVAQLEAGKTYAVWTGFDEGGYPDKTIPLSVEKVEDPIDEILVAAVPNKTTYCVDKVYNPVFDGLQLNVKYESGKEELWSYDKKTGLTVGGEQLSYYIDWEPEETEAILCLYSAKAMVEIPLTVTEEKEVISAVHFTVPNPAAGEKPQRAVCAETDYVNTEWNPDDSYDSVDVFEAGRSYMLNLYCYFNSSYYSIDPEAEVTVNGVPAELFYMDGSEMYVFALFTVPEPTTTTTTTEATTTEAPTTTTVEAPTTTTENAVTPTTTAASDVSEDESGDQSDESGISELVYGDGNGDGVVDMKDVLLLRKFLAGLADEIDQLNADVNVDKSLDMKDVLMIRKFLAHMIEKLG